MRRGCRLERSFLTARSQPDDGDQNGGYSQDDIVLNMLGDQARGLGRFLFDGFVHNRVSAEEFFNLYVVPSHPSPSKLHFLLAYLQVTTIDHFGNDVAVVFQLEVDQVRFTVFDLIDGRLLSGIGVDVGEGAIMEDGSDIKWSLGFVLVLEP